MRKRTIAVVVCFAAGVSAGCGGGEPPVPPSETPTMDVTSWTDKTELFMEYPPLVTGQSARFAVHLTTLADFKALNDGHPTIQLTPEAGGPPTTFVGSGPLRPGAFRVEGTPPGPGRYKWALMVEAPGLADRHDLGVATVFGDEKTAFAEAEKAPPDDPAAISYLKEQQWTNDFATAHVQDAELRSSIRVPAVLEPLTGGEAAVTAPASGRFAADSLLSIGSTVTAGQVLGHLEPRLGAGEDRASLAASVEEARAQVEAARAEQVRAERLLAERAVPARRVEDARRTMTVAELRLKSAEARLAQRDETLRSGGGAATGNAFALRAPIAGRVAEVSATLGASYDEGAPLFKIVRTDRLELRADVPAADVALARKVESIAFEIPGRPDPMILEPHHMHDAGVLNSQTKALPLQFEVDNPRGQLLVGQSGTAILFGERQQRMPAIPKAAVLMEAGRPYVFVQLTGESFARRAIDIVARDGDLVGIRSGVALGERVVVRGAYEVQLASAARGLPAEGHVH